MIELHLEDYKSATQDAYARAAAEFVRFIADQLQLAVRSWDDVIDALAAYPRDVREQWIGGFAAWLRAAAYAPSTIDARLSAVRSLLPERVAARTAWPPRHGRRHRPQPPWREDVDRLFRRLDVLMDLRGRRDHAIMALLHFAALTIDEVIHLRATDVLLRRACVRLPGKHWQRHAGRFHDFDDVPLCTEALEPVREWLGLRGEPDGILFRGIGSYENRPHMRRQSINKLVKKRCEQAQVSPLSPRALRESGIRRAVEDGSLEMAKRLARLQNHGLFVAMYGAGPRR